MESLAGGASRACVVQIRQSPQRLAWIVANLPFSLQVLIVVHFCDDRLAEFIGLHSGIGNISKLASDVDFQHFILDVMNRVEKRENKKLKDFCTDFVFFLQRQRVLIGRDYCYSSHWPTMSLGLGSLYRYSLATPTQETSVFEEKFLFTCYNSYAVPTFPISLEHLLPEKSDAEYGHLFQFPSKIPKILNKMRNSGVVCDLDFSLRDKFCCRLANMFQKLKKNRHHEALFVCVDLLESSMLKEETFYRNLVWGGLAVILSVFNLSDVCIQSCIFKMESLLVFESDKYDIAWVKQQVYSNQNKTNKEREMFEIIFHSSLPKASAFCSNSLRLHLETQLNQFNDWICEIVLLKKTLIVNRSRVKDQIRARAELAHQDISRLRKLLHHVFSLDLKNYDFEFKEFFAMLHFYSGIFRNVDWDYRECDHENEIKLIECSNAGYNLSQICRLLCSSNDFNINEYRNQLQERKENVEKETHQKSSRTWANDCFMHFVFLAHTDSDLFYVEWMLDEALSFYKKGGHYRSILLKDFKECETTGRLEFENEDPKPDADPVKHISVETLFRLEPKLKYFALAGTETLKLFNDYY